jgi:hypothetical protein
MLGDDLGGEIDVRWPMLGIVVDGPAGRRARTAMIITRFDGHATVHASR